MDLSIIILNYNTKDLTLVSVNSILEQYQNEISNNKFEIVLVDNNSTDLSLEAFRKLKIPGLTIIESKENLGFSKGCNLGTEHAKGEYLLFLNSDTQIKDQGFIKMIEYLKSNKNVGILGGKLKNPDGTSQLSAGKFYNLFNLTLMLLGLEKKGLLRESPNEIKKVDWVSGASFMIKKSLFNTLGGFNKEIFMYMEDMELCFRAKKKGFSTYFFPSIMLFHLERGSSDKAFAILNIYKGLLIFYKKHKPKWQYLIVKFLLRTKSLVLVTFGKIMNNKYLKDTYSETLKI